MVAPSFQLLGVHVNALTKEDLLGVTIQAVRDRAQCIIGNHNSHSLYLWSQSQGMRDFYACADYVQIDGMPLVWLGRLLGLPLTSKHRTTNLDLLPHLAEEAVERRWRLFYLGSRPGVGLKAASALQSKYPGLQIAVRDGYFDTSRFGTDNQSVLTQISAYAPDILMVGMGMPRQEMWIAENRGEIRAHTILCCGGLMDLVAGQIAFVNLIWPTSILSFGPPAQPKMPAFRSARGGPGRSGALRRVFGGAFRAERRSGPPRARDQNAASGALAPGSNA